ncbi:hypothetical protein H9I52_19910 [Hymenobacter sp. BT491]|nr:hypothetical protein [Hymenobacter sp. BT491]
MKSAILISILLLSTWSALTHIRDRNAAVRKAELAYSRGDFDGAARSYRQAVEAFGAQDESILLNLAHASARAGQPVTARSYYNRLLTSKLVTTRSVAQQQLAVLAAQKGDYAQATALSRRALQLNPNNAEARYNYEVLREYLTRNPNQPHLPRSAPQPSAAGDKERRPRDPQSQADQPRSKAGNDRTGELNDPTQPTDPLNAPQRQPDANGQRDPDRPSETPGSAAAGGFQPGSGANRSVAQGSEPGDVRGLSYNARGPEASEGRGRRAGTEQAAFDEAQLQTQRARLQQMNVSAGQARQILDALHASEQQYLQQLPHKGTSKTASGKPNW